VKRSLLLVVAVLGCDSSSPDTAKLFVGTWSCVGTYSNMLTSPQTGTFNGGFTEYLSITEASEHSLNIAVTFQDGSTCMKHAVVSGTGASFTGSMCPIMGGSETYTSGTLVVSGAMIHEFGHGSLMGTIATDAGSQSLAGTQDFDATCGK
jgi:hypothetical protein